MLDGREEFDKVELPKVPGLPQNYIAKNGSTIHLRNMELRDQRWLYDFLIASAKDGQGYTMDDFPPYQMFRQNFYTRSHIVIVEMADTKQRIACILLPPSSLNRSRVPTICDTALIVDNKLKGVGIGTDLTAFWLGFSKELGYKASMSTQILSNMGAASILRKNRVGYVGVLPLTGYMAGTGWTDATLRYQDLEHTLTFTQLKQAQDEKLRKAKM